MGTIVRINVSNRRNPDELALISLRYTGDDAIEHSSNIKFELKPLWEFCRDTDSPAFDFLMLSVIVYNVDRLLNRSLHSNDGWKRDITLEGVPARNMASMNAAANLFERSISFLTGDKWTIHFAQYPAWNYTPVTNHDYQRGDYSKVALFSGGLDSLIGFVDEAYSLRDGDKMLLISHVEQGKEGNDQKGIMDYCTDHHIFEGKYSRIKSSVSLDRYTATNKEATESTFRSRSLLFFAMGIYCAFNINGRMPLIVPENGTISINIPLNPSRRSACSTRTTHPVFMKRLEEALHAIGIQNTLCNPYRLKSKADMMRDCCGNADKYGIIRQLYGLSCSCAKRSHNFYWDKPSAEIERLHINHCGMCLPCIYRRVALDVVNLDDPALIGTDINHGNPYDIDNLKQRRGRDYRSLLLFLRRGLNPDRIRKELVANHITEEIGLDDYVNLVIHSYQQVIAWVARKGSRRVKQIAGIR